MNKYVELIIEELNKKFGLLTKLNNNGWLIQSKENSRIEAFEAHTTENGRIIMSGDYGHLIVKPHGNVRCLPAWMASATTLSYFAEKVMHANRFHKCKEYSMVVAKTILKKIKEILVEDLDDPEKQKKEHAFDGLVRGASLECEHEYWVLISELEREFDMYDLCEHDPAEYTYQIKWQHKCLVFWANKVLDGSFIDRTQKKNVAKCLPVQKEPWVNVGINNDYLIFEDEAGTKKAIRIKNLEIAMKDKTVKINLKIKEEYLKDVFNIIK